MRALLSAVVYFGTFLSIGYVAKRRVDRYMKRNGDLRELRAQYRGGGKVERFLLGTWYKD